MAWVMRFVCGLGCGNAFEDISQWVGYELCLWVWVVVMRLNTAKFALRCPAVLC